MYKNLLNTNILGPTPSTIFRVNNIYRFGIILKYKQEEKINKNNKNENKK